MPDTSSPLRRTEHPIDPIFTKRWSPRAFDGEAISQDDLLSIIEAARWAPSCYNVQPWRFIYSHRNDENWETFLGLLDPFNQTWAKNASALVIVISNKFMPGGESRPDKPSHYNSFDTGAACAQLALQATRLDYQAHTMAGIYHNKIAETLDVPEEFKVEVAIAIGKQASPTILDPELQEREVPSQRFSIEEISFTGKFKK